MAATAKQSKARLGRGLSALIGDQEPLRVANEGEAADDSGAAMEPIEHLKPNPHQPRRHFDEDALQELATSLKDKGMLQPILVRPRSGNRKTQYEIVAGERRWRAAQMAHLHEVPIVVRELADAEVAEIAIIENVQRADLNPIEEGVGYQNLIDRHSYTQEQVAAAVGKSRSHVANLMRLVGLPDSVQALLRKGDLSMGHARALLKARRPEALAEKIVAGGLSVRAAEKLAQDDKADAPEKAARRAGPRAAPKVEKDADTRALEEDLARALGLAVSVEHEGEGGQVVIRYGALEQLDEICRRLCQA